MSVFLGRAQGVLLCKFSFAAPGDEGGPYSSVHLASMDAEIGEIEEGTQKIKPPKPLIYKDCRDSLEYNIYN